MWTQTSGGGLAPHKHGPGVGGVVLAGQIDPPHDPVAVDDLGDLVGVLLDDREQVRQQVLLDLRQVARDRRAAARVRRGVIDRRVPGDRHGALGRAAGDRRLLFA